MKVVLLHQSIATHDAIGNDIAHMYEILVKNHEVSVYCTHLLNKTLKPINREELLRQIIDENNLLIYHHSNYWEEGEEILNRAKAKVIVKYHCITPPAFFENYSEDYFQLCEAGRKQTNRLVENYQDFLWIGDSHYNLVDAGIQRSSMAVVVSPFTNIEAWRCVVPDEAILKSLMESPVINLLFVGRIAPHKGHRFLIDIVRNYVDSYGLNIALYIIGKRDDALFEYYRELDDLVSYNGLEDSIFWVEEVSDREILSYYLGCDFYLNCSEHEGFCVPIVEAQSLCLPVISRRKSAVPETIGAEQLLLENDLQEYSAAIRVLSENDDYRDYLVYMGKRNYEDRFLNSTIENSFVSEIESFTGVSL